MHNEGARDIKTTTTQGEILQNKAGRMEHEHKQIKKGNKTEPDVPDGKFSKSFGFNSHIQFGKSSQNNIRKGKARLKRTLEGDLPVTIKGDQSDFFAASGSNLEQQRASNRCEGRRWTPVS